MDDWQKTFNRAECTSGHMGGQSSLRVALTVFVYVVAVVLGGSLFVPDPTSPWIVLPPLAAGILVVHAVKTAHLDELGYAIAGMWATLLAISIGAVVVGALVSGGRGFPALVEVPFASAVGTVGVTIVLVATYLWFVGSGRIPERIAPASRG